MLTASLYIQADQAAARPKSIERERENVRERVRES